MYSNFQRTLMFKFNFVLVWDKGPFCPFSQFLVQNFLCRLGRSSAPGFQLCKITQPLFDRAVAHQPEVNEQKMGQIWGNRFFHSSSVTVPCKNSQRSLTTILCRSFCLAPRGKTLYCITWDQKSGMNQLILQRGHKMGTCTRTMPTKVTI